jgi:protein O-GlcNAc transferase
MQAVNQARAGRRADRRKSASAPRLVEEGNRLRLLGDEAGAEEAYRRASRVDPLCVDAWAELGCLTMDWDRFAEAAVCFRHVARGQPASDREEGGDRGRAIVLLRQILKDRPAWAFGCYSLGLAYVRNRDFDQARAALAGVDQANPVLATGVHSLFAWMYQCENQVGDALRAAGRALALQPDWFLALTIQARCFLTLGRGAEAVGVLRRALRSKPHAALHSTLLFCLNHLPGTTPEALYEEARRWDSCYAAPLAREIVPHANLADPERRLKIGYVSPDLSNHPIMRFLPPVVEGHDRSRFDIFVYSLVRKEDVFTSQVRRSVENFVEFRGSARELTSRIRADEIDILVDLAGHTSDCEALLAFARKPAPIQVTWLGFWSTTGMSAMDYFLGDACMPRPGTEHLMSEAVYRLPCMCCYRPAANLPVGPAPCLHRGYITFGCFNNPQKINREVVKLWADILRAVPQSRLLLKYMGMDTAPLHQRFQRCFAENGIAPERLRFAGASPSPEYLAAYGDIDIALDPFPYTGGTTTADTLWMGVPVVTLAGRLAVQRSAASILTSVGLTDMVAETPRQYLDAAVFLAGIVPQIPELRANVRQALERSPLMDEVAMVRSLEAAYREMWRRWCTEKTIAPAPKTFAARSDELSVRQDAGTKN